MMTTFGGGACGTTRAAAGATPTSSMSDARTRPRPPGRRRVTTPTITHKGGSVTQCHGGADDSNKLFAERSPEVHSWCTGAHQSRPHRARTNADDDPAEGS